jgi:hypothetical protein
MTTTERVQAVADYGFTEREARFLVLVMRHAGLCGSGSTPPTPASPMAATGATPCSTTLRARDSRI